ncbi:Gag-Pol polyprotein, partial [Schistosoma japonicum]
RFVARGGYPQRLYSDNGSNFKGAERAIKCLMRAWNQEKISKNLATHNCDWIFNPPK